MLRIGVLSMSNFATTGASVPSGSCDRTVGDLVAHVLRAGVAVALEVEEDDDASTRPRWWSSVSSSMPSMVLIASSIGLVTLLSISSTLAPFSVVVTVTIGKSTFGIQVDRQLRGRRTARARPGSR